MAKSSTAAVWSNGRQRALYPGWHGKRFNRAPAMSNSSLQALLSCNQWSANSTLVSKLKHCHACYIFECPCNRHVVTRILSHLTKKAPAIKKNTSNC